MGEECAGALQLCRERFGDACLDIGVGQVAAERAPHRLDFN